MDIKQLREDVEKIYSMTPTNTDYPDGLSHEALDEMLELIEAHQELLKTRGYDRLKTVATIIKYIKESSYMVADAEDYTVMDKNKDFACDLVNYLSKQGYTILTNVKPNIPE